MARDLVHGPIVKSMLLFALPLTMGNLLQQLYNITDTAIVGRFVGSDALAAVGSAYSLMTFVTSIIIGLCLGSTSLFSLYYGRGDKKRFCMTFSASFVVIAIASAVLMTVCLLFNDSIVRLLNTPAEVEGMLSSYLFIIYLGLPAVFMSNFLSAVLRSTGESRIPLVYYAISVVLNIFLDLLYVLVLHEGVAGAAMATVISQYVSAVMLFVHTLVFNRDLYPGIGQWRPSASDCIDVVHYSFVTCLQQSVMNFGILMVQGLVNSFGVSVMAAFAAGVKIDSFAYLPVQDFGNAYSVFISQNRGAGQYGRMVKGTRSALAVSVGFALILSLLVNIFASSLFGLFMDPGESEVIGIGIGYMRLEGSFYAGIAVLFLLYGHFRAVGRPSVSLLLTAISLGLRVLLSYVLAPSFGYQLIWVSIPVGWALADIVGYVIYRRDRRGAGLAWRRESE